MKIELTHDTLAKSIYDKASHDDKALLKIANFIKDRQLYYQENKTLLSKKDLEYIAPYLDKIVLDNSSNILIKNSKRRAESSRRLTIIILVVANLILLAGIGYITYAKFAVRLRQNKIETRKKTIQQINEDKARADKRVDSLLQLKAQNAPSTSINQMDYAQRLINSYDTLKKVNKSVEKEKKIAQSATLSSLAATALIDQTPGYAFQLAAKAWQLNQSNQQAIEIIQELYEMSGDHSNEALLEATDSSAVMTMILHQKKAHQREFLNEKDMAVIFEKHNKVLNARTDNKKPTAAIPLETQVQNAIQQKK